MSLETELMKEVIKDALTPEAKARITASLAPKLEKTITGIMSDSFEDYVRDIVSDMIYDDRDIHEAIRNQVRAAFKLPPTKGNKR